MVVNTDIEPPSLRSVRKDQKAVSADQELFGPLWRPIGNGNNGPDSQLSWILASICEKAADTLCNPNEYLSPEEVLNVIDQENKNQLSNQCCFSLDAVARMLYRWTFLRPIPDLWKLEIENFSHGPDLSILKIQNFPHIPHWDFKMKLKYFHG